MPWLWSSTKLTECNTIHYQDNWTIDTNINKNCTYYKGSWGCFLILCRIFLLGPSKPDRWPKKWPSILSESPPPLPWTDKYQDRLVPLLCPNPYSNRFLPVMVSNAADKGHLLSVPLQTDQKFKTLDAHSLYQNLTTKIGRAPLLFRQKELSTNCMASYWCSQNEKSFVSRVCIQYVLISTRAGQNPILTNTYLLLQIMRSFAMWNCGEALREFVWLGLMELRRNESDLLYTETWPGTFFARTNSNKWIIININFHTWRFRL